MRRKSPGTLAKGKPTKGRRLPGLSLMDQEPRYRRLFEAAQDGILILDAGTGAITDVNPCLLKMLGYSRQEFLGKKLWETGAFEDFSASQDAFEALQAAKYMRYEDLPLRAKDGHLVQVEFVSNVYVAGGQHVIQCNIRDITARRRAEEARQEGEDQLRALVSSLEDIIIEMDGQGKYLNVWTGNQNLLAEPKAEMLGRRASEILGEELSARVLEASGRVLAGAQYEDIEYPLEVIGGRRWFLARISPVPAAHGVAKTVCMLVRDITDRRQAETLQAAAYRIAAAAGTTGSLDELYPRIHQIISSVMPAENFYITIYDAAQDLLRFPYFKDIDDEPFMAGVQPGKGLTAYVLRTGKSLLCTQAVHDDLERRGEVKLLGVPSAIWLGVPLLAEGKTFGAMVVQHYSDPNAYGEREQHMLEFVSTQVALAINRKQAEDALRENEARFRAVTESANDAIISTDSLGSIVSWNPAAERILGYSSDEACGRPLSIIMPSSFHGAYRAGMARLAAGSEPEFTGKSAEGQGRRKDGSQFLMDMSLSVWQVAGNRFYTAIVRDTTERKQTQDELHRAKDLLETINRQLKESLARQESLARTDGLTGLRNRFNFDELAALEFRAAVRYHRTLSVMMLDADDLKGINDKLGHAAGDQALKLLAQAAALHSRVTDVLARYGGDEFILLLPETTAQQALVVAERIRDSAATPPVGPSDQPVRLTLSIGIADLRREPMDQSIEQVLQRADKALYFAKTQGRNRAVILDFGSAADQSAATGE